MSKDHLTINPEYFAENQISKTQYFQIADGAFLFENTRVICPKQEATRALELQPRLFVLLDADNTPLGAAILPKECESEYHLEPLSLADACSKYSSVLIQTSKSELAELVADIPNLYSANSSWSECLRSQNVAELPLSISLLYKRLKDQDELQNISPPYPKATTHIHYLIDQFGRSATSLLFCVKNEHDCKKASDLAFRYPEEVQVVCEAVFELLSILDLFEVALYTHKPEKLHQRDTEHKNISAFKQRILELATQTVRGAILHHLDDAFRWEMVEGAFGSLQQVFDLIFDVTTPTDVNTSLSHQHLLLSEFFSNQYATDNSDLLAMAELIIETHFFRSLAQAIPGEFQEACALFYPNSGNELEGSIATATGDTEQELSRYQAIIDWLQERKYLPNTFSLLDAGVGHGRILSPLMEANRTKFDRVVGLDYNPQRKDVPWETVQADLGKKEKDLLGGGEPHDMVLSTWSVLQDLPYQEQKTMLENINTSLRQGGILVIDIASSENYTDEIEEYHAAHPDEPYGIMVRDFTLSDGTTITKKFTIGSDHNFLNLFKITGFELVSEPLNSSSPTIPSTPSKWRTKGGHIRHTFVLKKVREPEPSLTDWYQTVT